MSALYILDWHNRNSAYIPMYPPVPPHSKDTKDELGHMIAENFWIPKVTHRVLQRSPKQMKQLLPLKID